MTDSSDREKSALPDKQAVIVGFVSVVVMFITLFSVGVSLLRDPGLSEAITFSLTAATIASEYPLPFSQGSALQAGEEAMLGSLDPFSGRVTRSDYDYMREEYSGGYGGIGITVTPRDTVLMVMSVRKGGPADSAGMQNGDYIVGVAGRKVPAADPSAATEFIRGPSGTPVEVTVYRPRLADTLSLSVMRENIRLEHVPYAGLTADRIGYIRIDDFESGAADQVTLRLERLEAEEPVGYILDMTGNPGGYLHEAIAMADLFLEDGALVVGTDSRSRWERRRYYSNSDPVTERPVVILTDGATASAAEILTGALRGADRAVVVGDTTFGKGLVQTMFGLSNHDALRLTISRYYFADGRYLNPPDSALAFSGLAPDIVYKGEAEWAFRQQVLAGFLLYDFVDAQRDMLSAYPTAFAYPDSVVSLFADFARSRQYHYQSRLTEALQFVLAYEIGDMASKPVLDRLEQMLDLSRDVDNDSFRRHADFVNYQIRRLAVEQAAGVAASYRDVIVPSRGDIRLATALLLDREKFEGLLAGTPEP